MKDTADPTPVLASRPTYVRHLVLAALCLITTINYLQRNSLAGAETTVRADFEVERNDTGAALGAFFLTYALFQVPSGWLAQRWGGGRALTIYAAGWSIVMALSAAATNLTFLVGARAVMGAFSAGIFPCSTMILSVWYPVTRRGFTSAVLNSFMLIGGAIASWVTGYLIGPLGWRWLFALYAAPGLVWSVWFALWFRNRPQEHPAVSAAELAIITSDRQVQAKSSLSHKVPWLAIFLSMTLWLICIQQFCRAASTRFFDMWLPTYLQEAGEQSVEDANYLTSLPLLAGVLGGPIGGIFSDFVLTRTRSRRAARSGVAFGSILVGLLIYVLAYQVADVFGMVLLASLGYFIWTFSSPCAYALSMDLGGRNLGIIFATMNMAGNLGAWAFTTFIPRVVSSQGWDRALLVFASLHVVALACWLVLNPNGIIGEPAESEPASSSING